MLSFTDCCVITKVSYVKVMGYPLVCISKVASGIIFVVTANSYGLLWS